jgi:hypothetical protein
VLDVRFLPNPVFVSTLSPLSGEAEAVPSVTVAPKFRDGSGPKIGDGALSGRAVWMMA